MAKFQMGVTLSEDALVTARLGAGAGAANNLSDADKYKPVKLVADSRFDLCAVGDPIEGFIQSIESATLDGYTIGSVQVEDRYQVTADGLQATPGTGAIAVGDFVVCSTPAAKGTAVPSTGPKVCKATWQPGTTAPAVLADVVSLQKVANYGWRVVAITAGTGAVGDTLIIERTNR